MSTNTIVNQIAEFSGQPSFIADLHAGFGSATCGELIQGRIQDEYFLVNCPINHYSHIHVQRCGKPGIHILTTGQYGKLAKVLEQYLKSVRIVDIGLTVTINTSIPRGKGMASSTSELTAALCAAAKALDRVIMPDVISDLIIKVDPSDGIYYPGIIRYNPLTGTVYESFGSPPALSCIIVDTGGTLITKDYDRERARTISLGFESKIKEALKIIRDGFVQRSAPLIAAAATISARCNQQIRHNPIFETLFAETRDRGALGINCAHTGTIYGILFDSNKMDEDKLNYCIESIVGRENILGSHKIIAGGV